MADVVPPSARATRSSVIIRALVEVSGIDGPNVPSERRIRNLSRTGACIDDDGTLRKGMGVRLAMGSIKSIDAQVMWVTERLAGIQFAWPVDLEEARRPRGSTARFTPSAGWAVEVDNPYLRRG